jgi:hypothetical protein
MYNVLLQKRNSGSHALIAAEFVTFPAQLIPPVVRILKQVAR